MYKNCIHLWCNGYPHPRMLALTPPLHRPVSFVLHGSQSVLVAFGARRSVARRSQAPSQDNVRVAYIIYLLAEVQQDTNKQLWLCEWVHSADGACPCAAGECASVWVQTSLYVLVCGVDGTTFFTILFSCVCEWKIKYIKMLIAKASERTTKAEKKMQQNLNRTQCWASSVFYPLGGMDTATNNNSTVDNKHQHSEDHWTSVEIQTNFSVLKRGQIKDANQYGNM